ncbi:MAG: hypothetical protein DWQ37_08065 [Planctomycetota bacterium]|nr:MAG: hypothetical protein DWQ37_08065 [Planctomycetota bacterium]
MSARKRKESEDEDVAVLSPGGIRPQARRLIIAAILVVLASVLGLIVWRHVRDHVLAGGQYQVQPDLISISPPPEWIRGTSDSQAPADRIKSEALRDLTRGGALSLLDADLTVRVASAFSDHPWVSRVDRVSKSFPSGLEVALAYRTPVAMVEVDDGTGVLPVDEQGVVLPTKDFTSDEVERYPRIAEIYTRPAGAVGTRWGDAAVHGAAQIAAAISRDWGELDFARIVPVERKPAQMGVEYTYAVITRSGSTVYWGRAPGTDTPGELPAPRKIAQLKRYAEQNQGTLDGADGPQEMEFGQDGSLLRRARPVIAPLPSSASAATP